MTGSDLAQYVLSGLSLGCVYALVALGFILIAKVTGVYNFAQGDYVMVGGMLLVATHAAGWPTVFGVMASVVGVALIALIQERLTLAPVRDRISVLGLVVASLGFGILLRGCSLVIWGADPLSQPSFDPGVFELVGARLDNQTLWIWGTTVIALAGIAVFFARTMAGKAMSACAANPTAARLIGIRLQRSSMMAFILSGALTGLVGAMTVPLTGVSWSSGITVGLIGFIAAALAEFKHPGRAVIAGLVLGVVETTAAGTISSEYNTAFIYGILLVYLLGKDLFGEDGAIRRLRMASALRRGARRTGDILADLPRPKTVTRQSKQGITWRSAVPLVLLALAATTPFLLPSGSQEMTSATLIVLAAIGATGLGLTMGLAGLFSLGQGAFYLLSGYCMAILSTKYGWDPLTALVAATLLAVTAGLVIGWLTLRLEGFHLAIATLAIQLILLVVVLQQESLTGGALGVIGVPPLSIFGFDLSVGDNFFWAALAVLALSLLVARNLTKSRIGRGLTAAAADDVGAASLGVNTFRLKLLIFVVGAAMAGIAGAMWASYLQFATPDVWDFNLMIALLTYVVVGGMTSVYGGAIGAVVVGSLQYYIQYELAPKLGDGEATSEYQILLNGFLLLFFVLIFRDGLSVTFGTERMSKLFGSIGRRIRPARSEPAIPNTGTDPSKTDIA